VVSASKIANEATRSFAEKTGVACSGTNPTLSCSFVTSLKYALTTRAAAGLSWPSRPRSRNAERRRPMVESTVLKARRTGHEQGGDSRRLHSLEWTTVLPLGSDDIK
jgi:hypothetical protein